MPAFTVYINTHGEVYKYLINNAPFTSYLKLVKVDSETGKQIPYAGAAFHLYDANGNRIVMKYTYPTLTEVDTFYTSADGYTGKTQSGLLPVGRSSGTARICAAQ